jgi:hypothetical protein
MLGALLVANAVDLLVADMVRRDRQRPEKPFFRRMAARGAAATVLALAKNLPKIADRSSITAAQDVE